MLLKNVRLTKEQRKRFFKTTFETKNIEFNDDLVVGNGPNHTARIAGFNGLCYKWINFCFKYRSWDGLRACQKSKKAAGKNQDCCFHGDLDKDQSFWFSCFTVWRTKAFCVAKGQKFLLHIPVGFDFKKQGSKRGANFIPEGKPFSPVAIFR